MARILVAFWVSMVPSSTEISRVGQLAAQLELFLRPSVCSANPRKFLAPITSTSQMFLLLAQIFTNSKFPVPESSPHTNIPQRQRLQGYRPSIPAVIRYTTRRCNSQLRPRHSDRLPSNWLPTIHLQQPLLLQRPILRCSRAACRIHLHLPLHGQ
jgi:hypothetical protein